MGLIFKKQASSPEDISQHLESTDELFVPKLSSQVDIKLYAEKLHTRAVLLETWNESRLVGLVAIYLNDRSAQSAFITSVSVCKEFARQGIASKLMAMAVEEAKSHEFGSVKLEVAKVNLTALTLYRKLGFVALNTPGDKNVMVLKI